MKGPNASLPCVDELTFRMKMTTWNNIPIPIKEAFEQLIFVFKEFKQIHFQSFNTTVTTQRVVNMNQAASRTDCQQVRYECQENTLLSDQKNEKSIAALSDEFKGLLKQAESEMEEKMISVIN